MPIAHLFPTEKNLDRDADMDLELTRRLSGKKLEKWKSLLERSGLLCDSFWESAVLVWDGERLVATGARDGGVLKLIAVDGDYRGEDLAATVIGALRTDAFLAGVRHLFIYTKPENEGLFSGLFFYPVAKTSTVCLLENKKNGAADFIASLPRHPRGGRIGAAVMNCNPFTKGHQYLIERAAAECDFLYIFVVSEDRSLFRAEDRLEMVKRGTAHLENVLVLPTGPYLISSATFPTYFIKDRDRAETAQCHLDIEIFADLLAPALSITHRYLGSEPLSALTKQYNEALMRLLPSRGIEVCEIERLEEGGAPISASAVREALERKDRAALDALLPPATLAFLSEKNYL